MDRRGVSPVVSTILVVAIVVILAATISVTVLDTTADINEPTPNVAETTGEFTTANGEAGDEQVVQVTHVAGDDVDVEDLEIIVQASGPDNDLPSEARLVNLPGDGIWSFTIDAENIEGDDDLIDTSSSGTSRIIVVDDSNVWSAGDTIQFRIGVAGADFRDPPRDPNPEADELEVTIVHTPSDAIIFEDTFTA